MAVFKVWGIDQTSGQMKAVEDTDTVNLITANDASVTLANQVGNTTLTVASIDGYGFIQFNQSTANVTLTIPAPTNTTKGKSIVFTNTSASTQPITVSSSGGDTVTLQIGQSCNLVWNGSVWRRFPCPVAPSTIQQLNATGTVTDWDSVVEIGATPLTSNITITLPSTNSRFVGYPITFKRLDNTAFTVTIVASGSDTTQLNSNATELNTQFGALTVTCVSPTKSEQTANIGLTSASAGVVAAEFGEVIPAPSAQQNFTNTVTDVANSTFILPSAGTWEVTYHASLFGNTNNRTTVFLTDSANVEVPSSRAMVNDVGTSDSWATVSQTVRIVTSGSTTYKMRGSNSAGSGGILQNNQTANIASNKIAWKKISGFIPVTGTAAETGVFRLTANIAGQGFTNNITSGTYATVEGNPALWNGAQAVIPTGRKYRLRYTVVGTMANTGLLAAAWVDSSNNPVGATVNLSPATNGVNNITGNIIEAVVTNNTGTTQNYTIRFFPGDSGAVLTLAGSATSTVAVSSVEITQIGAVPTIAPLPPKVTIFTSSGTFTKDPLSLYAIVEGVGGGGSGGYGFGSAGANTSYVGCGGGSGAYFKALLTASQLGTSQAVTIGTGGGAGAAGGATTFGTLLTANGGSSGAGVYTFSGTSGLTTSTMTPTMSRANFTISSGVNLGSQLGNLPTNAFVASATGSCVAITSDGADSEMGRGARGLKSSSSPPHLTTPGNFVGQAAAANTGGGGSGDSTYSPNASNGTPTTTGAGGSGIVRITEYYQ